MTFSPGEHIDHFIDSVDGATARPTLVVMADNGSTDGAPERAVERARGGDDGAAGSGALGDGDAAGCEAQNADGAAAPRRGVELFRTGGNLGYGRAINAAARHLRARIAAGEDLDGEFFLVANPDVEFIPGSIDRLLDAARRHPRAGAIGPIIRQDDGSAYPSARAVPDVVTGIGHALLGSIWPSNPFTAAYKQGARLDEEREAGWLSGSCLLLRWDAFDSVAGFDERYFMYMEDVDLGDRLGRAGWLNIFTPTAEIRHDQGHSADSHKHITVPAHHDSAYRFQADRHPGLLWLPLRVALWVGLKARAWVTLKTGGKA